MKIRIISLTLIIFFSALKAYGQWPGYFVAFELKDQSGNYITPQNADYKMTPVRCGECTKVLLGIDSCTDKKTLRFYIGYEEFDKEQMLKVEKISEGKVTETLLIKFPPVPPREPYKNFSNYYIGEIIFTNGNFEIKLPRTKEDWENIKEVFPCPDQYNYNGYGDISRFQK
jgi:hypothetical protein